MHFTKKNQDQLLELAAEATESTGWAHDAIALAAMPAPDTTPLAVGVYQGFRGGNAEFHFVSLAPRMERKLLKAYTEISFNPRLFGIERLWCQIAENNLPALLAALRVGFQFEYRQRTGFASGRDAIVLSMTAAQAVFAPATHPNEAAEAA